jgi:hypothetical protein
MADLGGGWGITKKEFFIAAKNTVFEQVLKRSAKRGFEAMNTGVGWHPSFRVWVQFTSKTGIK